MMSSFFSRMCLQAVGVDNTFRRKFDKEEYLERARKREQEACFAKFSSPFCLFVVFEFE